MDFTDRFRPIGAGAILEPLRGDAHPFQDQLWLRGGSIAVAIWYIIAATGAILSSCVCHVLIDRGTTRQDVAPVAIWLICAGLTGVVVVATTGQNRVRAHLRRIRAQYKQDFGHIV